MTDTKTGDCYIKVEQLEHLEYTMDTKTGKITSK
jgi:hypothetical protein